MLVVCGCGPGVALAGLFLAGNVRGASRQILVFQGLLNCLAGVSLGLLLIADNALGLIGIMDWMGQRMPDPAARIAVVYLANMALAWIFGVFSLPFIEEILNRIEPPTQTEDIACPAYIHDEAVQVPETATILADQEMWRFLDLQIQLLDCVRSERNPDSYDDPKALHEGMTRLQYGIRDFLAELLNQQLDRGTSVDVLRLERRLDQLETLEASIYELTKVYSSVSSAGRATEIMTSLLESSSLVLLTLADVWTYRDPIETDMLLKMTTDRGELMERVRLTYRSGSSAELESDSAVFYATTLFERIIWLCRQITQSLDVENSALSA